MKEIKEKLTLITKIWNDFILESRYCQSKINYTKEVKSNYYGDLMFYLSDTFELIKFNSIQNNLQEEIFESTSVLQLIYVHQDLIEELLYIFKFDKGKILADCPYRKHNRDLRNELIGHPIRRNKSEGNKLVSSVLFEPRPELGKLEYIIYSSKNNFRGKEKSYLKDEIISNHKLFLNKFFDIILDKLKAILIDYLKEHEKFFDTIIQKLPVPKLVPYLECKFEYVFNTRTLSKPTEIIELFELKDENPRFEYALNEFIRSFEISMLYKIISIHEITKLNADPKHQEKLDNLIDADERVNIDLRNQENNLGYKLSKLIERHPVFKIDGFKREFANSALIIEELDFMEENFSNDTKYKSGWLTLKKMISEMNASH